MCRIIALFVKSLNIEQIFVYYSDYYVNISSPMKNKNMFSKISVIFSGSSRNDYPVKTGWIIWDIQFVTCFTLIDPTVCLNIYLFMSRR
jgi:hypothetical protein